MIIEKNKKINNILCPKCGEICIINIKDYKITLNNCDNGHRTTNILIEEYLNQIKKIDESKIICNICNKNKSEVYKNQFYKCCKCNINLCPLCKSNHDKEHIIIDYELKYYICNIHGERYISYCKECKKNLCDMCELEHNENHNYINYREILPKNEISNNLKDLRKSIDNYKNTIQDIIKIFNETINYFEKYYELSND